jgi:hypothetical protein
MPMWDVFFTAALYFYGIFLRPFHAILPPFRFGSELAKLILGPVQVLASVSLVYSLVNRTNMSDPFSVCPFCLSSQPFPANNKK